MNGASADPCAKISSAPTSISTMMIGSSHHFLRTFMKAQTQWQGDQDSYAGAARVYEAKGDVSKSIDQWSAYLQQDCCSTYSKDVAQPKLAELAWQALPAQAGRVGLTGLAAQAGLPELAELARPA